MAREGVRLELSLLAKHRDRKVLEGVCDVMGVARETIRERKGMFEARMWFKSKQSIPEGGGSGDRGRKASA